MRAATCTANMNILINVKSGGWIFLSKYVCLLSMNNMLRSINDNFSCFCILQDGKIHVPVANSIFIWDKRLT